LDDGRYIQEGRADDNGGPINSVVNNCLLMEMHIMLIMMPMHVIELGAAGS